MKKFIKLIVCTMFIITIMTVICFAAKRYYNIPSIQGIDYSKKGWVLENSKWYYYRFGEQAYDEVVKSGDKFYFINYDGEVDYTKDKVITNDQGKYFKITEDGSLKYLGIGKIDSYFVIK